MFCSTLVGTEWSRASYSPGQKILFLWSFLLMRMTVEKLSVALEITGFRFLIRNVTDSAMIFFSVTHGTVIQLDV
jgi:hypothetical protein